MVQCHINPGAESLSGHSGHILLPEVIELSNNTAVSFEQSQNVLLEIPRLD
jgi:hypothetical protein